MRIPAVSVASAIQATTVVYCSRRIVKSGGLAWIWQSKPSEVGHLAHRRAMRSVAFILYYGWTKRSSQSERQASLLAHFQAKLNRFLDIL